MARRNRKYNRRRSDIKEGIKIIFYFVFAGFFLLYFLIKGIISMCNDISRLLKK